MNRMLRTVTLVVLASTAPGCEGFVARHAVRDTGYVGTWSRGNERTRSIIAITMVDGTYRFRWAKRSVDGSLRVTCDWDGRCEEWFEGEKVAEYRFRSWQDSDTGHLLVEAKETRTFPQPFEQHYVDELVVEPGGRVLWSYTLERNGESFPRGQGPRRSFDKVGDGVAYPPRPTS